MIYMKKVITFYPKNTKTAINPSKIGYIILIPTAYGKISNSPIKRVKIFSILQNS